MDEKDLIIKKLLSSHEESKTPFGFEGKVMDKIQRKIIEKESRIETARNITITFIVGIIFLIALLILNKFFFQSQQLTTYISTLTTLFKSFKSQDSLPWILTGINLAILIISERLISNHFHRKSASNG